MNQAPFDKVLRLPALKAAVGLSQSTIYAMVASGKFPKPIASQEIAGIHSRILHWLESLPDGCPLDEFIDAESDIQMPRPPNGWLDFVSSRRSESARLCAEIWRVTCAPIPSADAKKLAREHVDALVARGAPDVFALIESGTEITYPVVDNVPLNMHGRMVDVVAFIAWLDPKKFISRIETEIDQRSDNGAALSAQSRADQIASLQVALLKAERAEEAAIEAAERDGSRILRRVDADPRAVLWLADTLPPPK